MHVAAARLYTSPRLVRSRLPKVLSRLHADTGGTYTMGPIITIFLVVLFTEVIHWIGTSILLEFVSFIMIADALAAR